MRTLTRLVECPLFFSYAFVHLDRRDTWRPVRTTPGVRKVLTNGNQLQFVRPGTVETLQASEPLRHATLPAETCWAPGMACSLATGALRNQPAVLMTIDRDHAVVVLMMFGELREVTVPIDGLVPRQD